MKSFLICLLCCIFAALNFDLQISAQTTERKKPKIKDFGSSLKRNPNKNSTQKKEKTKEDSDEETIKINSNLVVVDCLVTDAKGNVITGLKPEDFIISEDNNPQEIQTFALGDDAKVSRSIVLIIDYSGSQIPYIERSVEAAKLLVDKLRPNDLMAIVTDDVELIAQFTADKKTLKNKLNSLKKESFLPRNVGKSRQLSALYAVLNEMFDAEDVRPIIIFQTDGDELVFLKGEYGDLIYPQLIDRKTNFSSDELIELTNKSRTSIYSVFPGPKLLGLTEEEKKGKMEAERIRVLKSYGLDPNKTPPLTPTMKEMVREIQERMNKYYPNGTPDAQEYLSSLSEHTGGWLDFLEDPEQADGIYNRILSDLNTRYIIGYPSTNETKDGKRRIIKIEVKNHPEYTVWGRKFYFASLPD